MKKIILIYAIFIFPIYNLISVLTESMELFIRTILILHLILLIILLPEIAATKSKLIYLFILLFIAHLSAIMISYFTNIIILLDFPLKNVLGLFLWVSIYPICYVCLIEKDNFTFLAKYFEFSNIFYILSILIPYILFYVFNIKFGEIQGSRIFGPLGDQIGLVLVFFTCYSLARKKFIIFGLSSFLIIITGTRIALLSLFFSSIFILNNRRTTSTKINLFNSFLVIAIIILLLRFTIASSLDEKITDRYSIQRFNETSWTRELPLILGLNAFIENPLSGLGFGEYTNLVFHGKYDKLILQNTTLDINYGYVSSTSNQLLQTAVDSGIIGLLFLLIFFYFLLKSAFYKEIREKNVKVNSILIAAKSFTVSLVLINQTSIYLIAGSLIGFYLFFSIAIFESYHKIHSLQKSF
jgi:O-antigen ligase